MAHSPRVLRSSVVRASDRCTEGHSFNSFRGLRFFSLFRARDMLITVLVTCWSPLPRRLLCRLLQFFFENLPPLKGKEKWLKSLEYVKIPQGSLPSSSRIRGHGKVHTKRKQQQQKLKQTKTNPQLYDINALSPRVIALIGNCPLQSKFNNIELLLPISDILRCKCTLFDELTDKCFCIATSYAVTDGNVIASAMKQYCVVII